MEAITVEKCVLGIIVVHQLVGVLAVGTPPLVLVHRNMMLGVVQIRTPILALPTINVVTVDKEGIKIKAVCPLLVNLVQLDHIKTRRDNRRAKCAHHQQHQFK